MKVLPLFLIFTLTNLSAQNSPGSPKIIGERYQGTSDINIFVTLIYHSFSEFNLGFFQSLVYKPKNEIKIDVTKFQKAELYVPEKQVKFKKIVSKKFDGKYYSFPNLPPKVKVEYLIEATFPIIKSKDSEATINAHFPVAEIDGKLYIINAYFKIDKEK